MTDVQLHQGSQGEYKWLTSTEHYSGSILKLCPEVVTHRYLAVTSLDSGILRLTVEQQEAGWQSRGGIGYSPKLASSEQVPHQRDGLEVVGYDEYYIFEDSYDLGQRSTDNIFLAEGAPSPGKLVTFESYFNFVLHDDVAQPVADLFWPQLERLRPESYIADGRECLTFVSRNKELFRLVHSRLALTSDAA